MSFWVYLRADTQEVYTFRGGSDPSAAAAVDEHHFITGDDEHNSLAIYSACGPEAPVFSEDISNFLKAQPEHPEADIEGAARIGQRIYWITSHGRNKEGQFRASRYRFFATQIKSADNSPEPNCPPRIVPVGKPYSALVSDMLSAFQLRRLNLRAVTRLDESLSKREREQLAPKEKGFNIEGLAAAPDGRSLWIGLRNPLYKDHTGKLNAIVIPLLNPDQVIEQGKSACFGDVILLDLGGRGIRSIEYVESQKEYWIIAGPSDSQADFEVFRYHPLDKKPKVIEIDFPENFTPEGLFVYPGQKTIWFISDDGTIEKEIQSPSECMPGRILGNGRCPNKYLCDLDKRTFRVFRFSPPIP